MRAHTDIHAYVSIYAYTCVFMSYLLALGYSTVHLMYAPPPPFLFTISGNHIIIVKTD